MAVPPFVDDPRYTIWCPVGERVACGQCGGIAGAGGSRVRSRRQIGLPHAVFLQSKLSNVAVHSSGDDASYSVRRTIPKGRSRSWKRGWIGRDIRRQVELLPVTLGEP